MLKIKSRYGTPEVDLFASRHNNQVPRYVAWQPVPAAEGRDAFSLNWRGLAFYAFPPIVPYRKMPAKYDSRQGNRNYNSNKLASSAMVPLLKGLLKEAPMIAHTHKQLLVQPVTRAPHSLHDCIDLLICRI